MELNTFCTICERDQEAFFILLTWSYLKVKYSTDNKQMKHKTRIDTKIVPYIASTFRISTFGRHAY